MASSDGQPADVVHELLLSARELVSEMATFSAHFAAVADTFSPDGSQVAAAALNHLKQQLRSEIQGLEGLVKRLESDDPTAVHSISSTNLPFFKALWGFAKYSRDIVALRRWVCNGQYQGKDLVAPGTHVVHMPGDSIPSKNTTTLVDIIAEGGRKWVKISATTSKRLLWDMTKLGWALGMDDEEDEDDMPLEDEFDELPLFKLAKGLATSAKGYRIRNQNPEVLLVLPRIAEGESKDIDIVLAQIRKLGISLLCSNDVPSSPPLTTDILHLMAPNPLSKFSEVLNIDTSILIALVSDFSHDQVEIQPWFSSMQLGHLANEKKRKIITTWMYPAMSSRKLICTKEAADTCRKIVNTIGTDTEVARLKLLLCEDPSMTREQILDEFRLLSKYPVPAGLKYPVRVLETSATDCTKDLPAEAWQALEDTSEPTRTVFAYGWATQQTTLTSNGIGINSLTRNLEDLSDSYRGSWPSIWLCPFSRSLVGVPKHVRDGFGEIGPHVDDVETEMNGTSTGPLEQLPES
jgi:hypothetical protein